MDAGTTIALVTGVAGLLAAGGTAGANVLNSRSQRQKNQSDATIAAANLTKDDYVQIITQQRETIEWMTEDRKSLQVELTEAKSAISRLEVEVRNLAARLPPPPAAPAPAEG